MFALNDSMNKSSVPNICTQTSSTIGHDNWRSHYEPMVTALRKYNSVDLTTLPTDAEREGLLTLFHKTAKEYFGFLSYEDKKRIENEIFYTGPLEDLLQQSKITEICINGHKSVWYEQDGQLHQHHDSFYSDISFNNFLLRLNTEAHLHANLDRPFADGQWRHFRVHLIIPPLTQGGAHLSLRRHPDNPWTLEKLEQEGWAPHEAIELLEKLIADHKTFLIIGATGTGKTSLLNACLQNIKAPERIVTIEDSSELRLPNHLSAKLLTRTDPQGVLKNVDQMELLRQALRMRPDRIIMGEIRGPEAKDLLMTLSTGHHGGMGTLHADNPRQALIRLEMLIQLGAPQWSLLAIRNLIYLGLQFIVTVVRHKGRRRLASIHRLVSIEETGICLDPIYENREMASTTIG